METLKLTIYSDYVCPWCYVGQGAVEKLEQNYALDITWRPYYLRPDTPPEGMELPPHVKAHMAETNSRLKQMADSAGLPMVFPDRLPNTAQSRRHCTGRLYPPGARSHRIRLSKGERIRVSPRRF